MIINDEKTFAAFYDAMRLNQSLAILGEMFVVTECRKCLVTGVMEVDIMHMTPINLGPFRRIKNIEESQD